MISVQDSLDYFTRRIDDEGLAAHGVHILRGTDQASHRWTADIAEDIHSVSKGVCVLAAGIASDQQVFDIDERVGHYLPQFDVPGGSGDVPIRRLLTMTSGVDFPWSESMFADYPDVAREFLSRTSPGERFQYSEASTYTAMRALGAVVGDVMDWLMPRLFEPLEIRDPMWGRCPNGWITAGGGLALRTSDLARIGQLIRDRGTWDGRQIVDSRWIDAMHSDWVVAGENEGYDRYALAGWAGPGAAWRLHGALGQFLIFDGDSVVTITADQYLGDYRMAQIAVEALSV